MLQLEHVKKSFGQKAIIRDLSMEVPEGEIFGFIGQNGAGKTTTMKMILGLLQKDSGSIYVNGEEVTYGQNKTNGYIGYLPDVPEFYPYMKPKEYLRLCGELSGMDAKTIKNKSEELLAMVGLDHANKKIGGFSRGMKQRLGIAQALLNSPKLLICDEPTSALDPVGRKELLTILKKAKEHTTVIFSTHILSDVEQICDRIAVLNEGMAVMQGTLSEIKKNHKKDSLRIAFDTSEQANQFLVQPKLIELEKNKIVLVEHLAGREELFLHTREVREVQKQAFSLCCSMDCYPREITLAEPTLESLFMEVVKA